MPGGTKAKGCVKLRRCSKFKSYYAAQRMVTDRNKDRGLRRHLRDHPWDLVARERYGKDRAAGIALSRKGRER